MSNESLQLIRDIKDAKLDPQILLGHIDAPRDNYNSNERYALESEARFVADQLHIPTRDVHRAADIPMLIAGGSFITGTSAEVLYASITTGTQLNTFTTEDNLMKTLPACILPAGYFYNLGAAGKSIKIRAYYRVGTTTTPTMTFSTRLRTNRTWAADGVVVSSAAITLGSTVTLAPVQMDFDIVCRAIVDGATGTTLAMIGMLTGGTAFAATGGGYSMPNANTAFTVTLDNTVTQYVYLSAACGTSNAANLIQLEMIKVYGEN